MEENKTIIDASAKLEAVKTEVHKTIIGQETLVENLLIALISGGHILLEWVPGVAKTLTIDTLSKTLDLWFKRIQFTPDLLPSDLVGTEIYNMWKNTFDTKKGPIFANFLLADEINRAPSKVQSALLEAMAEKQVTIGDETYQLPEPFIVLATQNPIEQSGTYKLPEAQLDRFLLKAYVEYPTYEEEKIILESINTRASYTTKKILSKEDVLSIKKIVSEIHVSDSINEYATNLVFATRDPEKYDLWDIWKYMSYGVSPRWSISLIKGSQAVALLRWRDFVIPEDIKYIAKSALAHRLVLNYEAIADDIKAENIIESILEKVKIA